MKRIREIEDKNKFKMNPKETGKDAKTKDS